MTDARRTLKMRCLALSICDSINSAAWEDGAHLRREYLRAARERCLSVARMIEKELEETT